MKKSLIVLVSFAVITCLLRAAQDKYAAAVPGGLAFSEFRGYEGWQTIPATIGLKLTGWSTG